MIRDRRMDVALALAATVILALAACLPRGTVETAGTACPLPLLLGLDCPYCGLTRSFVAFGHGDLAASFRFHPAGPLLVLGTGWVAAAVVFLGLRRGDALWGRPGFERWLTIVLILSGAAGVARHLFA